MEPLPGHSIYKKSWHHNHQKRTRPDSLNRTAEKNKKDCHNWNDIYPVFGWLEPIWTKRRFISKEKVVILKVAMKWEAREVPDQLSIGI